MERTIFISYCWGNGAEVDIIDKSFLRDKVKLKRDMRDINYKDSIKLFMKQVRQTDYVLMIISDEYLKSKNCMFEVLEVLKDDNYQDRIFPIVLNNAYEIYSPAGALNYLKFWDDEYSNLKTKIINYSPEEVIAVSEDLKIIKNIKGSIVDFIKIISDINNISFEILQNSDFVEIKRKFGILPKSKNRIRYDILQQKDVSHAGAKRYSANILIDSRYSRDEIKYVIKEVTESLKGSSYCRDNMIKEHFQDKTADVVWLYFANQMADVDNFNWVCRTSWINPGLDEDFSPGRLNGNDSVDGIDIEWNERYDEMAEFFDSKTMSKGEFIEVVDSLIHKTKSIVNPLIEIFSDYQVTGSPSSLISYTEENQGKIDEVYNEVNNILVPPPDCSKLDEMTQSYFIEAHNLFLYFSQKGLETWSESNRKFLMKQSIGRLHSLEKRVFSERAKV